ncbi:MAG: hypothetical protein K8E66_04600 [Phycisphaerales bacterium]|nr:hypothetical protein [Phycisphaerales bacterium]
MGKPAAILATHHEPALLPATGRDHAALAILPFTVASGGTEPVTVAYQMEVDEQTRRVSVTLDTARSVRLPMPSDQTVLLGLLQLSLRVPEPSERLHFSRRDLFDVLQWGNRHDGYTRLREALHRLAALVITMHSEVLARDGRAYQQRDQAVHLVDRYDIGNGYDAPCFIVWGDIVREGFALGDFKRLDWDLLLALGNPTAMQLYRLLDRVTLAGGQEWRIGWRPLASALGMSPESYARPARFRQVLEPHLETLAEHEVIDGFEYERGGRFVFHIRNYLRAQIRRVLEELGVYGPAARQLVAGYDEPAIMAQVDCLQHGTRPRPKEAGGYLVTAVRERYELRYPEDEPAAFVGLWELLGDEERRLYHEAGLRLCGVRDSLFETNDDPGVWPLEFRAVVRFMVCNGLDPEEVLRRPRALVAGGVG